jgi:hypothetical protein
MEPRGLSDEEWEALMDPHCPMCGRHYNDHPACTACDSAQHATANCPLVAEYEADRQAGD